MSAASPGIIAHFLDNEYYPSDEAYLMAVADAMKVEYERLYQAGFIVQVDCPDLAMARCEKRFATASLQEFRDAAELHVEALNRALAGIPPEALRMHLCWGNYEGPHHHDVELKDIIDIVLKARPAGLVLESCNPRHEHEWQVFEKTRLPAGKVLIPGVIDTVTNFVEHPELVAQRIERWARVVGKRKCDCRYRLRLCQRRRLSDGLSRNRMAEAEVDGRRRAPGQQPAVVIRPAARRWLSHRIPIWNRSAPMREIKFNLTLPMTDLQKVRAYAELAEELGLLFGLVRRSSLRPRASSLMGSSSSPSGMLHDLEFDCGIDPARAAGAAGGGDTVS